VFELRRDRLVWPKRCGAVMAEYIEAGHSPTPATPQEEYKPSPTESKSGESGAAAQSRSPTRSPGTQGHRFPLVGQITRSRLLAGDHCESLKVRCSVLGV
jgi:hypothetical protein